MRCPSWPEVIYLKKPLISHKFLLFLKSVYCWMFNTLNLHLSANIYHIVWDTETSIALKIVLWVGPVNLTKIWTALLAWCFPLTYHPFAKHTYKTIVGRGVCIVFWLTNIAAQLMGSVLRHLQYWRLLLHACM